MRYLLLLFLCGCSYTHQFGQIGPYQMHKVQLGSIAGPTQTMFATLHTNTGEVTFTAPLGGNGILGAVASGSGQAAAGWFVGKGLERGNFSESTTINQSSSTLSAPVINVPDPPPAPPITRIRPPFGNAIGHGK